VLAGILTYLLGLPIWPADAWELPDDRRARLEVAAQAIVDASRGDRQVAAAVAVQGARESLFGVGWGQCDCVAHECDRGKAHGYWQWHRIPSEPVEAWEALCSVEAGPVLVGATRAAAWLRGCPWRDRACLAGRYARLGGLPISEPPDWAFARADSAIRLAWRI
jgi:hypothetical protein